MNEVTTTLHMEMNDVVYGSVIGNTTNPLMLEVDHWVNTIVIEKFNSQVLIIILSSQGTWSNKTVHCNNDFNILFIKKNVSYICHFLSPVHKPIDSKN